MLQSLLVLRPNPTLLLISLARFSQGLSPKVQNAYFFENCVNFGSVNGQTLEVIYGAASGVLGTPVMFFATSVAKKIGGENLFISDFDKTKAENLAKSIGAYHVTNKEIASNCDNATS